MNLRRKKYCPSIHTCIFLRTTFVLVLLLGGQKAFAQDSDYGIWGIYVGTGTIDEKWSIFVEAQYRDHKIIGDFNSLVFRLAGQYDVVKNVNLSLGYSHFVTTPDINGEKVTRHEYRPYQQVIIRSKYGIVYINHRYRFEQRILEDDFRLRFRYFLQTNIILNKPQMERTAIYISAYAEIFLNFESPVYDRTRVFVGLGYAISSTVRMEVGNLTQIFETFSENQLNIFLFHNFNL